MTFFLDFLLQMYLQLHPNQYLYLYMYIIDKGGHASVSYASLSMGNCLREILFAAIQLCLSTTTILLLHRHLFTIRLKPKQHNFTVKIKIKITHMTITFLPIFSEGFSTKKCQEVHKR